ncbi:peptide/nickel transport system substrate-binding protein [Leucobacter exalbidus]|uniref:Peptide/nickel transport system substrate-binding protein n=1 Tax=Leucobacter exalbidus TaxID=662960 RepID=A0A940PUC9_9MICO|nr:ABC transporter substrate-binding protein [Leucobacter exalbidus]MBP1326983.1 peptide/nickel transport system substrate-binding protein [Leucobacter exalbidus]
MKFTARARGWRIAAVALTAALALSGCAAEAPAASSGSGEGPVSGGTLTFGRAASVTDLDLHQQITANNAFAIDKIFEPLVSFDADGKIIAWLADYEVSGDGLTYTFTLHDGVKFSDGTEVTPEDVVFSITRHLEMEGSPLPIEAPVDTIEATGDREITITLKSAYTPFLSELAGFSNGVLPKDFGGANEAEFFKSPVGTGPWVLDEWDPNGDLSFVKNEHYWQDGKPYLDGLVYKFVADPTQLQQQLVAGQVDAVEQVPAANSAEVGGNAALQLIEAAGWSADQVFFNTLNEHFADEHVRRAIAHAIDRDGIAQATGFGTSEVANALVPTAIEYSANDQGYGLAYDVDAAKAELAKSKFADGFATTLAIRNDRPEFAQIAQIVQEQLAAIDIDVTIESLDYAVFKERVYANLDYDFMLNNGQADAPDPNGIISFQTDVTGFSKSYWTSFSDPEVNKLVEQGRTTADGPEREKIYFKIQKLLAEKAPFIPLSFPANLQGTTASVHDYTLLPNGSVRFQDAWIAQ